MRPLIGLLGGLALERDGVRRAVDPGRVESLLAYLVLHRDVPTTRAQLAATLWPDTPESQARTNVRKVLLLLRRAVPEAEEFLDVTGSTLQWRAGTPWRVDVAELDASLAAARQAVEEDATVRHLTDAVDRYRDDLLPGCHDDWLDPIRLAYAGRYREALRELVTLHAARGELALALGAAERLLAHDPLDEQAAQQLMRLHDARGDRARAVRVYHGLAAALRQELGIEPSPATKRRYDALLARDDDEAVQPPPVGRAPYVGRRLERKTLAAAWRTAEAGWASAVLLLADAGAGKSRLAEDFSRWCAHRGVATAYSRSYAAEGAPAYAPVVTWLRSPPVRRGVDRLPGQVRAALAPLLPEVLAGGPGPGAPPAPTSDAERRHRLWDAVAAALTSSGEPLLLVADDIHWADDETARMLHYVLRACGEAPLLVVATAREEELDERPALLEMLRGLRDLDRLEQVRLPALTPTETISLAERLVGRPLPQELADRLWRTTEGNPLFVVEAVRAGWATESPEAGPDLESAISPRVQSVLEARLAQLSAPARELVRAAAVVGREFAADVLADVTAVDEAHFVRALDELWRRRVIRERDEAAYDFAHDQIRAVAYAGTSPVLRRGYHLGVARALLSRAADGATPHAAVARHLELGGDRPGAVDHYAAAAVTAQRVHASVEAVRHLERARSLLRRRAPSPERDRRELALLQALPALLASVEGYASERLSEVHDRALQLSQGLGAPLDPSLLWSLTFTNLVREDFDAAEQFARQLRDRPAAGDVLRVEGSCLLGFAAFWRADFAAALGHLEDTVRLYRREHRAKHLASFGQDPQVVALARLANTRWFLGDPVGAQQDRAEALARAREVAHPLTTGAALCFAALLALDEGDRDEARSVQARLRGLRVEALPVAYVTRALEGYVLALDGDASRGTAGIRAVLEQAAAKPAAPGMTALLTRILLAAHEAVGDEEQVRAVAQELVGRGGSARVWEPTARRLLGRDPPPGNA